jgi:hypothetical protein
MIHGQKNITVHSFFNLSTYLTENMLHLSMYNSFFCLSAFLTQKQNITRSLTLRDMTNNNNGAKDVLFVLVVE